MVRRNSVSIDPGYTDVSTRQVLTTSLEDPTFKLKGIKVVNVFMQ
jgi:hypothetical protein